MGEVWGKMCEYKHAEDSKNATEKGNNDPALVKKLYFWSSSNRERMADAAEGSQARQTSQKQAVQVKERSQRWGQQR